MKNRVLVAAVGREAHLPAQQLFAQQFRPVGAQPPALAGLGAEAALEHPVRHLGGDHAPGSPPRSHAGPRRRSCQTFTVPPLGVASRAFFTRFTSTRVSSTGSQVKGSPARPGSPGAGPRPPRWRRRTGAAGPGSPGPDPRLCLRRRRPRRPAGCAGSGSRPPAGGTVPGSARQPTRSPPAAPGAGRRGLQPPRQVQQVVQEHLFQRLAPLLLGDLLEDEQQQLLPAHAQGGAGHPELPGAAEAVPDRDAPEQLAGAQAPQAFRGGQAQFVQLLPVAGQQLAVLGQDQRVAGNRLQEGVGHRILQQRFGQAPRPGEVRPRGTREPGLWAPSIGPWQPRCSERLGGMGQQGCCTLKIQQRWPLKLRPPGGMRQGATEIYSHIIRRPTGRGIPGRYPGRRGSRPPPPGSFRSTGKSTINLL